MISSVRSNQTVNNVIYEQNSKNFYTNCQLKKFIKKKTSYERRLFVSKNYSTKIIFPRLLLSDWRDVEKASWVDPQRVQQLDELDRKLTNTLQIAYMTGKVFFFHYHK